MQMAQQSQSLPPLDLPQHTHPKTHLDQIFRDAKSSFLVSLAPEERCRFAPCASADQLLADLRAIHHLPKARRGLPIMSKIQKFSDCLTPYFKVIEIVCQSNPEWSCIAWGAFRLVLQLATNFTTFFEKLSRLIERLAASLPQYADYYELLCSGHNLASPRILDSLMRFYVDMLDFFQAVAHIFTRPSGKLKRTPIVIADLLWCPFETRFQDVLERMKFHQAVLKDELNLASMKSLQSKLDSEQKTAEDARLEVRRNVKLMEGIKQTMSEQSQRAFRATVVAWIAPPPFKDNFENAQDSREDGTAEWIFDEPKFKMWMSSPGIKNSQSGCASDGMLWIQGNPGWGKTVMAASTIEELQSIQASDGTKPVVCYYFFSEQDITRASSARIAAYRAITAQIFHNCHGIEEIYNIYALATDGSNSTASEHELRDLLRMTIPLLSEVYLVLDGLDELNDLEKFLHDVQSFCSTSSAKVILFSRPHVGPLRNILLPEQTITLSRGVMNVDICVFVQHKLADLKDRNKFPQGTDLRLVEDEIVQRADGMFLWARLMLCYLNSPALTKSQRMSTIFKTTPVGLQQMYDRILSQVRLMDDASQQLATITFSWIAYAQKYLAAEECSDALYCGTAGQEDSLEKREFIDNAVIVVCCGLIEKRQNNTVRFVHLTAKEHLLSLGSGEQRSLILSAPEAHTEIATRCLSYLLFSLPAQPLSGRLSTPACPNSLHHEYALLPYSAKYWPKHMLESIKISSESTVDPKGRERRTRLFDLIEKFLTHPINITMWVEAAFLFGDGKSLHTVLEIQNELRNSLCVNPDLNSSCSTLDTFALFARDLEQIHLHWGKTLSSLPHEIWIGVPSFTKSRFLAQNCGVAIETLAPTRDDHPTKQIDPLFCIGSKNSDGTLIGKMTIYPSSSFDSLWKGTRKRNEENWLEIVSEDAHLQKLCNGWFVQYEIHRIGENCQRLLSKYFPLDPGEISLQLQFSFRLSIWKTWKFKFPMAISSDLSTIVVLRTIITTGPSPQQPGKSQKIFTSVPDFDRHERLRHSWSKKSFAPDFPYSYEWGFSSDSSYAILRDWNMQAYHGSLTIVHLDHTPSGIESHVIEYRELEGSSKLPLCAIHPFEPKLILLHNDKLIFKDIKTGNEHFQYPSKPYEIEKVEFSQCGKYYVLNIGDNNRPRIHALPWDFSEESTGQSVSNWGTRISKKRKLEHVTNGNFEMMLSGTNAFTTVGSSSIVVDAEANMVLSIAPACSDDPGSSQRIQLTRREMEPEKNSSYTLVTLPQTTNPRHTSASLTLLDVRDTKRVRIVLTPEVQSTYESDEPTISQHLPAILHRETATLVPSSEQRRSALTWDLKIPAVEALCPSVQGT